MLTDSFLQHFSGEAGGISLREIEAREVMWQWHASLGKLFNFSEPQPLCLLNVVVKTLGHKLHKDKNPKTTLEKAMQCLPPSLGLRASMLTSLTTDGAEMQEKPGPRCPGSVPVVPVHLDEG
jgi:hypothetical protein